MELFYPSNPGSTRYTNNPQDSNSVLGLVFLQSNTLGFSLYTLHPELQWPSDYVLFIIKVGIKDVNIDITVQSIKKNSDKEKNFIESLRKGITYLDTLSITGKDSLQAIVIQMASVFKDLWMLHSKLKWITKYSKEWWNQKCTNSLSRYHN